MARSLHACPANHDDEPSSRFAAPHGVTAARIVPRVTRHLAAMTDDVILRVRVVDEAHPMCGAVGTVTLRAFESAARSGAAGQFEATFASGRALVRFAQVELEPDDLGAAAAATTRP